jgi:RNA polymerase sigma factor (sigma-70 family)
MRYKLIIQALRESSDNNVQAFVKDVEKLKRLTVEERQYYLANREEAEAVNILVKDFIPYIIKVAYMHSQKTSTLSVLDLINEGIVGAYAAFEKCNSHGKKMVNTVRVYINKYISQLVEKKDIAETAEFVIEETISDGDEEWFDDHVIIRRIDRQNERSILTKLLSNKIGVRKASIIIAYYMHEDADLKTLSKQYGISRERIRQIVHNFSQLYRNVGNLWELLSPDFNLPVSERQFYQ